MNLLSILFPDDQIAPCFVGILEKCASLVVGRISGACNPLPLSSNLKLGYKIIFHIPMNVPLSKNWKMFKPDLGYLQT